MWRLILSEFFTYTEAKKMSYPELLEANAALDKYEKDMEKENKSIKSKSGTKSRRG